MVGSGVVEQEDVEAVLAAQLVGEVHEGGGGGLRDAVVDQEQVGVVHADAGAGADAPAPGVQKVRIFLVEKACSNSQQQPWISINMDPR